MTADLSTEQRTRLIELVREMPVLYDMKLDGYSNRDVKRQHWEQIAAQLAIPGMTADIVATKWKNTKDHYDRLRKKMIGKLLELAHQEQAQKLAWAKPRSDRELFGELVGTMCAKLDDESFEDVQAQVIQLINVAKVQQRKREAEKAQSSAGVCNFLTQYEFDGE